MDIEELVERQKIAETLQSMGYWEEERFLSVLKPTENPRAKQEVLEKVSLMATKERDAVLSYMNAGELGIAWMGYAGCRICGEQLGTTCQMTPDKKWRFPEKWQHYIVEHNVKPDEEFIKDAMIWAEQWDSITT